jgi:integrase
MRNGYLQAIRGFLNWCVETSRLTTNPLKRVAKADEKIDRRKQRRAMTETELSKLLRVAMLRPLAEYGRQTIATVGEKSKRSNWTYAPLILATLEECCRLAKDRLKDNPEFIRELEQRGRERMLVYKTLVTTGLRCNELRSITVGQVNLETARPFIELKAADEKNRQGSFISLRADLADELREWIEDRAEVSRRLTIESAGCSSDPSGALLAVPQGLIKILARDLATAGMPKIDERDRSLDVHALRTTFGTILSKAGVAPRTAQAAMRHSRIDLTMNVYTDPIALDISGAVESLPAISADTFEAGRLQQTGTESGSVVSIANTARTVAPTVAPAAVQTGQNVSFSGNRVTLRGSSRSTPKKQKNPGNLRDFRGL